MFYFIILYRKWAFWNITPFSIPRVKKKYSKNTQNLHLFARIF